MIELNPTDDILRKLRKAKYITTLDLNKAYHQIPMKEESKPFTAFTVPRKGHFHFKRMPFGLMNAGATFQRVIDDVIGPAMEPNVYVIIVSETFEEHKVHLQTVLGKLNEAGFTVDREKSFFCKSEVKYLGIIVDRNGIKPDPDRIKPIQDYPVPKNIKKLRSFLGMASWYRKFMHNFASLAEPLTQLTKKNTPMSGGKYSSWRLTE